MFAKSIIDSDAFLDMPLSTQALYFHLGMRADDDGFVNSPKRIMRLVNCSDDDLRILIAKNFIILFDSGVVVLKHWKIHNYIRSDRYKATNYTEEKRMLYLKENGAYTLANDGGIPLGIPNGIPVGDAGKDRLGKDNIGKCCSKGDGGYTDIWKCISADELDTLASIYEDPCDLVQAVYEDVKLKGKIIDRPYEYVIGYAQNRNWRRVNGNQ